MTEPSGVMPEPSWGFIALLVLSPLLAPIAVPIVLAMNAWDRHRPYGDRRGR